MSLANIVSKAYILFDYPKPMIITNVCTDCCLSTEDARKLLTLPLNEIPVELINEYNDGAQATVYDMVEFKYFLPRYLDLMQHFQFASCVDISLSLKNLNFGNDLYWQKKEEKRILEEFAAALISECISKESLPDGEGMVSILNIFHTAQIPIEPLLDLWKTSLNGNGMYMISTLLFCDINGKGTRILGAFTSIELSDLILEWIRANKQDFMAFIEDFIMNTDNNKKTQELSYCYDFLKFFN
jgi:hypothetical protein